jgi:hypothetical protein
VFGELKKIESCLVFSMVNLKGEAGMIDLKIIEAINHLFESC